MVAVLEAQVSYLEQLLLQQRYTPELGQQIQLGRNQAYASYFNPIDVSSPSQIVPNPYNMIKSGYLANEFAYSIMQLRAMAKSQATIELKQYPDGSEIEDHPLLDMLYNPNPAPNMTWQLLMAMKQITQDIAGFAAFELEYSNNGDILALWYMTPYFCSFLRGQQEPLRAIRYQPWGLQPMDIPFKDENGRPRILFFSDSENFDPLSDRVRFRSPMMAAFPQVEVDNAMTFFLNDFVKHGAKFAGLISVAQTIDDNQAADYRRRWRAQHGGAENWADPLILGEGATYSSMQMNFRDMAFPELDARTESRICNAFRISPIVADARAGLDVSSYNNKKQAEKDWYYNWVIPSWRSDASSIGTQLLPVYFDDPDNYYVEFDFKNVYALKEDRDSQVERSVKMYDSGIAKLNEARKEIELDSVPDGDKFKEKSEPSIGNPDEPEKDEAKDELKEVEATKFRKFAKQRVKEGKSDALLKFDFKYHNQSEIEVLVNEFHAYKSELLVLAEAINNAVSSNKISIV